jgi:succinate dehydrogenase / fumarate reductase cytochrome b subunit
VGRKIVMAVTGLLMLLFAIEHLLGNSSIFAGPDSINAYAAKLHRFWFIVWISRVLMLAAFFVHVVYGIQLTLEDWKAKPEAYAIRKNLRSTFASRTMIWSGGIIAVYLVYHLLHFTFHVIHPEITAMKNADAARMPDVFAMMVLSFQDLWVSLLYIAAMFSVTVHLMHGIQSLFQTLGLNNDRTLPAIEKAGTIAAIILFLGYISIPVAVIAGILKR